MGDPRRLRKKYETPMHPWQMQNIEAERELLKEYALKNKRELWKINSFLRNLKAQAKKLIALRTLQSEKERNKFMEKLQKYGLVAEGARLADVLALTIKDIMEARLQSKLFRRGLARSMKQARQFITHNHVMVNGRKISSPSYMVRTSEEISFHGKSTLASSEHPERAPVKTEVKNEKE